MRHSPPPNTPTSRRILRIAMLAAALAPCAPERAAAAPENAQPRPRAKLGLEEVALMMSSGSESELRSALEGAALLPPREVLPLLEDRVRAGLPNALLELTLDSLLLLDDRGAGDLLAQLARHRRPEIRARALEVLARLKAREAVPALTRALGDLVPAVRETAANGLGELGAHAALPALQQAFERGIDGSARALGRAASAKDVPQLLSYLARAPLSTLSPMFAALFARGDLAEAEKLRAVEKIAALDSEEARTELGALLAQLPADAPARLKRALGVAAQKGAQ